MADALEHDEAALAIARFYALQWHRDGLAPYIVFMPPRESSDPALPAIASISAVMRGTSGRKTAFGSSKGGAV